MSKINLVSDIRLQKIKLKKRNFFVTLSAVVSLAVILVVILILQGYKWSQVIILDNTKKKIAKTDEELKDYKDIEEMVINIEQGLKAINDIESSGAKWSKFLPVLEKVTPNDIQFTEFSQTGNKFSAKASGKSVQSISRLINSLESYEHKENDTQSGAKLFKNVNVDGYDTQNSLISFSVTFEMAEGVLW